jgi:hypothetical protein
MLELVIPETEQYDEARGCFITTKEQTLRLEHSLVSLSKWESKWRKPYLSRKPKTREEQIDYVRCMTLTQHVDPNVYTALTPKLLETVDAYINDPMTATTFAKGRRGRSANEIVTAEIIYYWMILHNIPSEYQKWHLNRLMTLINVCNAKNGPKKKMSQKEIFAQNRALNAARRKRANSRG